jgi:hypothetical protein
MALQGHLLIQNASAGVGMLCRLGFEISSSSFEDPLFAVEWSSSAVSPITVSHAILCCLLVHVQVAQQDRHIGVS